MAYGAMYEIEVRHEGLNKYRHIRGSDKHIVEKKATTQQLTWNEMWKKKQIRESAIKIKEENKKLATIKTKEAQEAINQQYRSARFLHGKLRTVDTCSFANGSIF